MEIQELIMEVDSANHSDFLKREVSVLHFFSDWQMDCLMSMPIFESLAEEFCDKIFFGRVNIEENEEIADKYQVQKVPLILVFKNGEIIDRIHGCDCEEVLREKIELLF